MKTFTIIPLLLALLVSSQAQVCYVDFAFSQNASNVYFANLSEPIDSTTSFVWSFGDGTSSTDINAEHYYSSQGIYEVCLFMQNANGCADQHCDTLYVDSTNTVSCFAGFNYTEDGLQLTFSNSSIPGAGQIACSWNFGDGSTSTAFEPVHEYSQAGMYLVCLQISSLLGCSDTYCEFVTVTNPGCSASFTFQAAGSEVQFYASNGSGGTGTYSWNFGDGETSSQVNPLHNYAAAGLYNVCLQYTDSNCSATACDSFYVNSGDSCYADFYAYQSYASVIFMSYNYDPSKTYFWDFGDGTYASDASVSHQFQDEGIYTVCLVVSDSSCMATSCQSIYYSPDSISNNGGSCEAAFEVAAIDTANSTVWLTEMSTGANSYLWSFGDGTSSTVQYPSHTYAQNGSYQVCLSIECDSNNTSSYCQWIGLMDSLVNGGVDITRSGFVLNVKPQVISAISPIETQKLTVFPNPVNDALQFTFPASINGIANLRILNRVGQLVDQKNIAVNAGGFNTVDLRHLNSGMYLLQLVSDGKIFTGSFVKQ
ncbi:MAG: PKD domain-containing protein [Chitinophagaceae bacterium]|nr:PKD domain-containing protein [Chitinophagaceae bacterium]